MTIVTAIVVIWLAISSSISNPSNQICNYLENVEAASLCHQGQVARSIIDNFPLEQTTRIEVRQALAPLYLHSNNSIALSDQSVDVYVFQERFLHDPDEVSFRFSEEGILMAIFIKSDTYFIK